MPPRRVQRNARGPRRPTILHDDHNPGRKPNNTIWKTALKRDMKKDVKNKIIKPFLRHISLFDEMRLAPLQEGSTFPTSQYNWLSNELTKRLMMRIVAVNADSIFEDSPAFIEFAQDFNNWTVVRRRGWARMNEWWRHFGDRCIDLYNNMPREQLLKMITAGDPIHIAIAAFDAGVTVPQYLKRARAN